MHNEAEYFTSVSSTKESLRTCEIDIFEVAAEILEENKRLRMHIKELTNTQRNL